METGGQRLAINEPTNVEAHNQPTYCSSGGTVGCSPADAECLIGASWRRLFMLPRAVCLFFAAGALSAFASGDPLIPHSDFRPNRGSEFHPGLVKLLDADVREILVLTGQQTVIGTNEEVGARNERIRALKLETADLRRLLKASSGTVREWALRTMGERPTPGLPRLELLAVATNRNERLFARALAVRVLGSQAMDGMTAETLFGLLDESADIDFQRIIMEALASGAHGQPAVVGRLARHLHSPYAAIQHEAFSTLRQIGALGKDLPNNYARASSLSELMKENAVEAAKVGLQLLHESGLPAYLRCTALRSLGYQTNQVGAVQALLQAIEERDDFISALAGNVLNSLPPVDARGIAALAAGIGSTNELVRLHALLRLNRAGQSVNGTAGAIVLALNRIAREGAPGRESGLCLEIARKLGGQIAPGTSTLIKMLSETSPVYRHLTKHEVDRVRGMTFVALAATGTPPAALESISGALANSDENSVYEFAGAARAAAGLGPPGRVLIPHLIRALDNVDTTWSDWIALETFDDHANANAAYTTPQVEALRALAVLGAKDAGAMRAIGMFAKEAPRDFDGVDAGVAIPNAREEALKALSAMNRAPQHSVRRAAGE